MFRLALNVIATAGLLAASSLVRADGPPAEPILRIETGVPLGSTDKISADANGDTGAATNGAGCAPVCMKTAFTTITSVATTASLAFT